MPQTADAWSEYGVFYAWQREAIQRDSPYRWRQFRVNPITRTERLLVSYPGRCDAQSGHGFSYGEQRRGRADSRRVVIVDLVQRADGSCYDVSDQTAMCLILYWDQAQRRYQFLKRLPGPQDLEPKTCKAQWRIDVDRQCIIWQAWMVPLGRSAHQARWYDMRLFEPSFADYCFTED
jgi:hypothetical protein